MHARAQGVASPIDMHVHIVGNGAGGTGCWLRPTGWRRLMVRIMMRPVGLPPEALTGDLDALYAERLAHFVRMSSLAQVVILAHEQPYDAQGRALDAGLFYTPNTHVLNLAEQYSEFLSAVAIHPARPDALEELAYCLARGAVMLKLLPRSQNVDCRDPLKCAMDFPPETFSRIRTLLRRTG